MQQYERGNKRYYCLFCGAEIFPEACGSDHAAYLFQCEVIECGAVYESQGPKIPNIKVYNRPEYYLDALMELYG